MALLYNFSVPSGANELALYIEGSYRLTSSGTGLSSSAYSSVGFVWRSDDTLETFVNGASKGAGSYTKTGSTTTTGALIGCLQGFSNFVFDGDIQWCAVWNGELSDEDFAELEWLPPQLVRPDILVSCTMMNAPAGSAEPDLVSTIPWTVTGTVGHADASAIVGPRRSRLLMPPAGAGGGQTLSAGLAVEIDVARAMAAAKSRLLGLGAETDQPLPAAAAKARAIGLAAEIDAAFEIAVASGLTIAQAAEADAALGLAVSRVVAVGLAGTTDEALALISLAIELRLPLTVEVSAFTRGATAADPARTVTIQ